MNCSSPKERSAAASSRVVSREETVNDHTLCLTDQKQKSLQDPRISIQPITPVTVPSYRRLITLLLPIRYPDKFFKDSCADTTERSLARVSVWRNSITSGTSSSSITEDAKVIGGIQCRLEDLPSRSSGEKQLYIQTIAVLSPFRRLGLATSLLNAILSTIIEHQDGVTSFYAHVWEANVEALEWYQHRGFTIEEGVIEQYYRRLKPSGARIVRRRIKVEDHLAVRREIDSGAPEMSA